MTPTFLLSSRLGLLHQPQGQTELNVGVEEGPEAVITPQLAEELGLTTHHCRFSSPDKIQAEDYYSVFSRETQACAHSIASVLRVSPKHRPTSIVVGGDHSVSLAHLSALLSTVALPHKTGILMLDSHADINLVKTSPTGNIHGMWLRPVVDNFDQLELDSLVSQKVLTKNLVYIGNQDLDPAEREFIKAQGIQTFSVSYLRENKDEVVAWLRNWFGTLNHLHLSIDVDGFDQSLAPATGIPSLDGLLREDVTELFAEVQQRPQWSLDLVEVNPQKSGALKTIEFTQSLLRELLSH